MARLRRIGDGAGDSGASVLAIRYDPEGKKQPEYKQVQKPEIGWCLQVGSISARSYSDQDWWQTTEVTEILEENENNGYYCKFKTGNSKYDFWY